MCLVMPVTMSKSLIHISSECMYTVEHPQLDSDVEGAIQCWIHGGGGGGGAQ